MQNFLSNVEFRFEIERLPNLKYHVQRASIPGITSGSIEYPTPFKNFPVSGDKLDYDDFTLGVAVDENMLSYTETLDWIKGITFPDTFTQHQNLVADKGILSDATLIILNSNKNPNIKFTFKDLFPVSIGGMDLDTTSASVDPVTMNVTFKYRTFDISRY